MLATEDHNQLCHMRVGNRVVKSSPKLLKRAIEDDIRSLHKSFVGTNYA